MPGVENLQTPIRLVDFLAPFVKYIFISTTNHPSTPVIQQVACVTLEAHGVTGRKSGRMNTVVARPELFMFEGALTGV